MTTRTRPFAVRLGQRMPRESGPEIRYDAARELTQVCVDGEWVDAIDARIEVGHVTRKTGVDQETTDDD